METDIWIVTLIKFFGFAMNGIVNSVNRILLSVLYVPQCLIRATARRNNINEQEALLLVFTYAILAFITCYSVSKFIAASPRTRANLPINTTKKLIIITSVLHTLISRFTASGMEHFSLNILHKIHNIVFDSSKYNIMRTWYNFCKIFISIPNTYKCVLKDITERNNLQDYEANILFTISLLIVIYVIYQFFAKNHRRRYHISANRVTLIKIFLCYIIKIMILMQISVKFVPYSTICNCVLSSYNEI